MIEIDVPGWGALRLEHVLLDVNGTIAVDGQIVQGVVERLAALRELSAVHLITADTQGRQAALDAELGLQTVRVAAGQEREQKAALVRALGAPSVCAIGNGANDAEALRQAALGIAVLGDEGVAMEAVQAANVLAPSIAAALDLLLNPLRLKATLRR